MKRQIYRYLFLMMLLCIGIYSLCAICMYMVLSPISITLFCAVLIGMTCGIHGFMVTNEPPSRRRY